MILGLRKLSPRDSKKVKIEHAQSVLAFRSYIQGEPEYLLQFLSRFSFVVKSDLTIISFKRDYFSLVSCRDLY